MAPTPDLSHLGLSFTSKIHTDTYADIDSAKNPALHGGRTVLVTGAARGMGQATVISYAKAGASRIAIADCEDGETTRTLALRAAADAGRQSPEVLVFRMDVCDHETVENCAAELGRKWGYVDIVINFAGYLSPFEPLGATDKDEWWKTWEVNVRGVYWVTRALLPLLLTSTEKTIINITSVGAMALTPGASAYQPSKLAVLRLADYLMLDYKDEGLLAYSVHPASVPTKLAKRMPEAVVKAVCNDTPELAGDSIVYLTSKRREWLAGRYVSCAWDLPEFLGREREIVDQDLLKIQVKFQTGKPAGGSPGRMRVPRSSY